MIELPKKLKDFDVYLVSPFTIFEKKKLLNNDYYQKLFDEFPTENFFENAHSLGNKKYFNDKDEFFDKFLNESPTWKSFYNYLNSDEFLEQILFLCKQNLDLIEERKKIKNIKIKYEYKKDLISRIKRKIKKKFGYYEARLAFEFSIMKNRSYIPPHNDTSSKLISLMIYFPDINQDGNENLGTNFYKNKGKDFNLWRGDMLDKKNSEIFYDNYEKFYTSRYEKNKLVGFLKSKSSWHDVSKLDINSSSRKSLNMNLYLID